MAQNNRNSHSKWSKTCTLNFGFPWKEGKIGLSLHLTQWFYCLVIFLRKPKLITYAISCLCIWILTDAFKAYLVDSEFAYCAQDLWKEHRGLAIRAKLEIRILLEQIRNCLQSEYLLLLSWRKHFPMCECKATNFPDVVSGAIWGETEIVTRLTKL